MPKFEQYEMPKKVEEFYKKPKSHEELTERIRILKEIPEDTSIPKVVLKLGSPEESHKFDMMRDEEGRVYIISLPIEKYMGHRDIYRFSEKLYKRNLEVIGGGVIEANPTKNEIVISGSSGEYGFIPKWKMKEILEQKFPEIKIKVDSKDGELIKDPEQFLELLESSWDYYIDNLLSIASKECLEELFKDKKLVKKLIEKDATFIKFALFTKEEKNILDNEEIVKMAVKKKAGALEYASDRLKDNEEIVKMAIEKNVWALRFASNRLRDNEEIVKMAIEEDVETLRFASDRLRDNEEIVKMAIEKNGWALEFASDRLKDNEEIVKMAVGKNGWALKYASDRLKDNEEIVKMAIEKNGWALEFASDRLKDNEEIVKMAIEKNGWALKYASDRLKDNEEIVKIAIEKDVEVLRYASKRLQKKFAKKYRF